jgi:crotonobetainyl-CoA:carnitine CoA-transferase CaiB-like acyl-CoA transferase
MPQPLEGLRVLELGAFVSAPYCGKLFAGYGAEVIKIEPPGGDISRAHGPFKDEVPNPETSALFLYLNTGKKSVVLDVGSPSGRESFLKLVETADVLIENYRPADMRALGLSFETLNAINPRLVMISVTTFGQHGPYADYESNNLVAFAMGGQMFITGTQDGGPLCMAPILEATVPYYTYMGRWAGQRRGNHMASFIGIYPCADGHLGIHIMPRNWKPFTDVIGRPDMFDDPRFVTQAVRAQHNDELMAEFYAWAAGETKHDIYQRAGAGRAPIAFVHTMEDLLTSPQLTERGFIQRIDHPVAGEAAYPGPPWWIGPDAWSTQRAPLLGEHNAEVLERPAVSAGVAL